MQSSCRLILDRLSIYKPQSWASPKIFHSLTGTSGSSRAAFERQSGQSQAITISSKVLSPLLKSVKAQLQETCSSESSSSDVFEESLRAKAYPERYANVEAWKKDCPGKSATMKELGNWQDARPLQKIPSQIPQFLNAASVFKIMEDKRQSTSFETIDEDFGGPSTPPIQEEVTAESELSKSPATLESQLSRLTELLEEIQSDRDYIEEQPPLSRSHSILSCGSDVLNLSLTTNDQEMRKECHCTAWCKVQVCDQSRCCNLQMVKWVSWPQNQSSICAFLLIKDFLTSYFKALTTVREFNQVVCVGVPC